jgi:hypothetical protein
MCVGQGWSDEWLTSSIPARRDEYMDSVYAKALYYEVHGIPLSLVV